MSGVGAAVGERPAVDTAMWRALGVFRTLALGYAVVRFAASYDRYAHIGAAIAVLVTMGVWTAWTAIVYLRTATTRRALLAFVVADLAVGVGCVLSTVLVDTSERVHHGVLTLPTVWSAAPVIAAAITLGWRGGLAGAAVVGAADLIERGAVTQDAFHNIVLMALLGTAIGYVTEIGRNAELTLVRAQRLESATRERQRLSRDIHDGVLQVLALVQRRGAEIGGAGADLGLMAGEQERALRSLVNSWHEVDAEDGDPVDLDLSALLGRLAGPRVTLSGPGEPVPLPSPVAREVAAAVAAALDNVRAHGGAGADGLGARAWILVEDETDGVVVTVRDDGPGIPEGRLEEARLAGRLGFAHSIEGRLGDVGGRVELVSVPGQGTEVEMRVPRVAAPRAGATSVSAVRKALR